MLKISKTFAAGLLSAGNLILSGQAGAQGVQPVSPMEDKLALPVGRTVSYFNKATGTAITENCGEGGNGGVVTCTLRVMSNTAQLDYTQIITYAQKGSGIDVRAGSPSMRPWNFSSGDFTRAKNAAVITQWDANAPLATKTPTKDGDILQNDVMAVRKLAERSVSVCSVIPINQNRGLSVCMKFNIGGRTVEYSVAPMAIFGSSTVRDTNTVLAAQRSFDYNTDKRYFDRYAKQVQTVGETVYLKLE